MSLRPRGLLSGTSNCSHFYSDELSTPFIYELDLLNKCAAIAILVFEIQLTEARIPTSKLTLCAAR